MGDRAVITTNTNLKEIGIYLHWNGGRDCIEAFLAYCKLKGYRPPEQDCYGWAYLAGVITNFFGTGFSCGIDTAEKLDCNNYDNGTYIIKDWLIVERMFASCVSDDYGLYNMLRAIDKCMPEHMKLSEEEWSRYNDVEKEVMQARANVVYHN